MGIKNNIKTLLHLIRKKEQLSIIIPTSSERILSGKTAIISGGSGGIGRTLTDVFVNSGCKVIITGTNEVKLSEIASNYSSDKVTYLILDLKNIQSIQDILCPIFENNKIDILVNCAGINNGLSFFDVTEEVYDSIMDVNVKGTYFLSQIIAKHMIDNGIKGHILNFSSASSLRPASQPYAISKWAITGITKGLADILIPYGITVNAIAPGPTATSMLGKNDYEDLGHETCPSGRYATTHEIANLALFMVSGMGDLIVGDTFYITGGSGTVSLHR